MCSRRPCSLALGEKKSHYFPFLSIIYFTLVQPMQNESQFFMNNASFASYRHTTETSLHREKHAPIQRSI